MVTTTAHLRRQKSSIWPVNIRPRQLSSLVSPGNENTLISLLESCRRVSEISQIHGRMLKSGLDHNPFLLSKLLASSIIDIQYADSIFHRTPSANLFIFNTILRGYSISDHPLSALPIFNHLRTTGILLDQFSFITTLKSCARVPAIDFGSGIHGVVLRSGHIYFTLVKNALLHFYGVCGRIHFARQLFDEIPHRNDVVSWNTLMGGYLKASQPGTVIDLFRQICSNGSNFSDTTLLCTLTAAGDLQDLLGAESLHGYCIKVGISFRLNVAAALIDIYAKVGCIHAGRHVFDEITMRDVALWNCLIHWYAKNNLLEESLSLLKLMKLENAAPNSSTLSGLLSACAESGALTVGRSIHDYIRNEGLVIDTITGTALVDMYAKCGVLPEAMDIFDKMIHKDVKSWTAIISAYGNHGQAQNAIRVFTRMEDEGFEPNEVAFLVVLSACSHGGLVKEAKDCFQKMVQDYQLSPKVEHYGCLIDLLGRAGLLEEAYNLIKDFPVKADGIAWRALLAGCRVYGNVDLGEHVKQMLIETCGEHPTDAILLSSTYAAVGRQMNGAIVQKIEEISAKEAGRSTILMDC